MKKHLKQDHEAIKFHNEIPRNQNDNIILHMCQWYKNDKKLKANNMDLRNKVKGLQSNILIKKPRLASNVKKKKEGASLDVLVQALEIAQ